YLLPDVGVHALDQRGAPLGIDAVGPLGARSDTALPIAGDADSSQWLPTGDLGRVSSNGLVSVLTAAA
ncbi:MAG TPA: hypothetical protein VMV45_12180, partial [Casimicrobiaceae bacterium]|nr:hypothetical protein [Casimicrobiaceae bacterium]